MDVLHLTDTHLGSRWALVGAPRALRAADHAQAMALALAPALSGQVDLVVHSGDLFDHRSPDRDAVGAARELLQAAARRVPVVVIAGNHDRDALRGSLGGIGGLDIADRPSQWEMGGVRFGLVPFQRTARSFAQACAGWDVDVLVAHQAFDGHRVPGFTFRAGARADTVGAADLPPSVRFVMCGHLHPRQVVQVGHAVVVAPGSTERTAMSEAPQVKGYARWTTTASEIRWRFVDLPARPIVAVDAPADLERVRPGTIAHAHARWEAEVCARGGYCALRRAQLGLFAR